MSIDNLGTIPLQCPRTRQPLTLDVAPQVYRSSSGECYPIRDGVVVFLPEADQFYEGAYLSRIRFLPKRENLANRALLWIINGGYLSEVSRSFKEGATILELGCAAGVDYFARRFRMIGLDLSFESVRRLQGYAMKIQAGADDLPFPDGSLDGIVSSYFWEHIPLALKAKLLSEFRRVLKPTGKLVFLYDVATRNLLLRRLMTSYPKQYRELFLEKDGHLGYHSPIENAELFSSAGFVLEKHFGMERTPVQSQSVYRKLATLAGIYGVLGRLGSLTTRNRFATYMHIAMVRIVDATFGRLFPLSHSRILMTVASLGPGHAVDATG